MYYMCESYIFCVDIYYICEACISCMDHILPVRRLYHTGRLPLDCETIGRSVFKSQVTRTF